MQKLPIRLRARFGLREREVRVLHQLLDAREARGRRARARWPAARTTCRSPAARPEDARGSAAAPARPSSACASTSARSAPERSVMLAGVLEALVGAARPDRVAALRAASRHSIASARLASARRPATPGRASSRRVTWCASKAHCPVGAQRARRAARASLRAPRGCAAGRPTSQLLGDVALARQRQHQLLEGGVERRVAQHAAHRVDEGGVERRRASPARTRGEQAVAAPAAGRPPSG